MKAVGSVRKLDDLGRVVIPKELRDALGLKADSPLEIFATTEGIFLRPYQPGKTIPQDMVIEAVQM